MFGHIQTILFYDTSVNVKLNLVYFAALLKLVLRQQFKGQKLCMLSVHGSKPRHAPGPRLTSIRNLFPTSLMLQC